MLGDVDCRSKNKDKANCKDECKRKCPVGADDKETGCQDADGKAVAAVDCVPIDAS